MSSLKVYTNYIPESCDYFTEGKVYIASSTTIPKLYSVVSDKGEVCHISLASVGCAHIKCNHWEVVL